MPSRLKHYDALLHAAQIAGYAQTSVRDYFNAVHDGRQRAPQKVIVHRHDIDTDLRTARKLFEIEQKYGIRASYYFRLSTLDLAFMREIEEYGSEASYHYEELATFAKKNRLRTAAEILPRLPEIREHFLLNFKSIEERLGRKITTVASHGDFANRRLKLNNTELLTDPSLREKCGIACETYDRQLLDHFDIYIADRPHPQYFYPTPPLGVIGKQARICLLTHPRQWETNWKVNTKDNLFRMVEGLRW